jgi:hypothetical protein
MLMFYDAEFLAHLPNPQAGVSSLVDCPRVLIECFRSYPPYQEALSIRNLKSRHAVVTRGPLNMAPKLYIEHSLSLLFFYRYDWFAAVLMNY